MNHGAKISASKKGKKPNRIYFASQDTRDKISATLMGSIPWNKGKKMPNAKQYGEFNNCAKKVQRNDGTVYGCITDAAKELNVTPGAIQAVLKGRAKTCKKFTFKYYQSEN